MANSITAAPSILAESVIASLKGKLPALRAFSSVFTAAESGAGKTVQVPLIGTSTATEFSTGGYLTQDDATITAANVTLKHFKVSSRFSPLDVKMYGAQFLSNAFVPTASNALAEKCLAEIGALITNANYSSSVHPELDLRERPPLGRHHHRQLRPRCRHPDLRPDRHPRWRRGLPMVQPPE